MKDSLTTLVTGLVDYAGLFPPAKLDMASAVREYAAYLRDPYRDMLGRFVVAMARVPEFEAAASASLPRGEGSTPWRLAVLAGPDVEADIHLVLEFNDRHRSSAELGHAMIDVLEIKASSPAEIASAMSRMPKPMRAFFELPMERDPESLIAELRRSGGMAKMRTGGITQDAFPTAAHIARFMRCCHEHHVAFKATAGLHHPIRAEYRLTYEEQSSQGMMYGYLNVFLAAAFAHAGADVTWLERVLTETNAAAFTFTATGVSYAEYTLTLDALRQTRETFAISFGSCSFREPVDELLLLAATLSAHSTVIAHPT